MSYLRLYIHIILIVSHSCVAQSWIPWSDLGVGNIPSLVYLNGAYYFAHDSEGIKKSIDNGNTWQLCFNGESIKALHEHNGILLTANNAHQLFRSADEGITWQEIPGVVIPGFGGIGWINGFYSYGDTILATSSGDKIYRSDDSGMTWSWSDYGGNSPIQGIIHIDSTLICVGSQNHHASLDGGITWDNMFPWNTPLGTRAIGKINNRLVKVTVNGLWYIEYSDDGGLTWTNTNFDPLLEAGCGTTDFTYHLGYIYTNIDCSLYRSSDGINWELFVGFYPCWTTDEYVQSIDLAGSKLFAIVSCGIFELNPLNLISGIIYGDLNNNNVKDIDEPLIGNHIVSESVTQQIAFSNSVTGEFNLGVFSDGIFPTSANPILYYDPIPSVQQVPFSGGAEQQLGIDFGFQPIGDHSDVLIQLTPITPFRTGFSAQYQLTWKNVGTTPITASVKFYPSSITTFNSATLSPSSMYQDSIVWNLSELLPFETGSLNILMTVDNTAGIGDTISSSATIIPNMTDETVDNNNTSSTVIVTAAYDPNDITVDRSTIHYESINDASELEYLIRFQNTGNDTAFHVFIKNPISQYVDLTSFEFIDSSHDMIIEYDNEIHAWTFSFTDIMLPDSTTDEINSHGFIRYRIKTLSTIMIGDSILSHALIYFDFNEAVITNTAVTVVVTGVGITPFTSTYFNIIPNPSHGWIQVNLGEIKADQLILHDAMGRNVLMQSIDRGTFLLDLSDYANGFYILVLEGRYGRYSQRLLLQ